MVLVKLLQDVAEGNVARKGTNLPLKTANVRRQGRTVGKQAYVAGAIIPMHEVAAEKYIARKLGEIVTDTPSAPTAPAKGKKGV
jgi:hypothetical protein